MRQTVPDFYNILGVPAGASVEEAKQAFRHLARQHHPDMHPEDPTAAERFRLIYHAYKVLTTPEERARYDALRARSHPGRQGQAGHPAAWDVGDWASGSPRPQPTLEARCTPSQQQLAVLASEQVLYLLSDLVPRSNGQAMSGLPLNLCLVVDRSHSMRGEKLGAVKSALRQVIERLEPEDILALIAFDNRPEVMVRAERQQFPHVLSGVVDRLRERGGTSIGEALAAALEEVSRFAKEPMTSHIMLLTDGQTYGDEARCLELAQQAHQRGISVTALGIGTEWNERLLDQIATLSGGTSEYLERADQIMTALERRVRVLRSTLATNVRLTLRLAPDARVRRVTRVLPDIAELVDATASELPEGAGSVIELAPGQVTAGQQGGLSLLWELLLPANVAGPYQVGQLEAQYDIPSASVFGQVKSERVAVTFVAPQQFVQPGMAPRVKELLEYVTAYRLQQRAHDLAQRSDPARASKLLQSAALRLQAAEESQLAREAQDQAEALANQGAVDRAAMLRLRFGTKHLGQRHQPSSGPVSPSEG